MKALSIAATGMIAQQLNVEVISNNIANMNTTGFKRQRAEFQDLLYQNIERVGAASSDAGTITPTGIQVGVGVKTGGIYRITEQGSVVGTENPLDLAINGSGYFRITLPSGDDAYTRAGAFQLGPTGEIVTLEGFTVATTLPCSGNAIQIPPTMTNMKIASDGTISSPTEGQIAKIGVVTLADTSKLKKIGNNMFIAEAPSIPATDFNIIQGMTESSNVQPVLEITRMISVSRSYISTSKLMDKLAEAQLKAINTLAKVS